MRSPFFTILTTRLLPVVAGLLLCFAAAAQGGAPGNSGTTGGPPAPGATAVPLDGGASLLLASGVAYGLKRLRQKRRKA
ncbi:MAG: PID-CTERM protein-sorting domain-containing protein [Janthinobacterium lividum]